MLLELQTNPYNHEQTNNRFLKQSSEEHKQIMELVRKLIHESAPEDDEAFKWSRPIFKKEKDFA